jgi:hypothetical protein
LTRRVVTGVVAVALAWTSRADAFVRTRGGADGPLLHWDTPDIAYRVDGEGVRGVERAALLPEVEASFTAWEEVPCADVRFTFAGVAEGERVGFDRRPGAFNTNLVKWWHAAALWPYDPGVIAVTTSSFDPATGAVLDADIELNAAGFVFTTGDRRVRTDVRNTLTHEAGHLLGFDHSDVAGATMFGSAPEGEVRKRTLHQDDVDGLCAVYPNGAPVPVIPAYPQDERSAPAGGGAGGCAAGGGAGGAAWAWSLLATALGVGRRRRRGT